MPIKFKPTYTITSIIAQSLMRIEAAKGEIAHLSLTPSVLASLRETARLYTTHYSTMIEGNHLTLEQIEEVLKHDGHFPGRQREQGEVKGYYVALEQVEKWAAQKAAVTEQLIQKLHALVMGNGNKNAKSTPYRDGQNVIRDGQTRAIVYLPPEAKDVPELMKALIQWLHQEFSKIPSPIVAGITHYEFATIHPYYDGNGRTARLLTTLILHLGGYDLKGLYSLEEYYARNLNAYYQALSVGPSHNYYEGRAKADITKWLEYFTYGMAIACENVLKHMEKQPSRGGSERTQEQLMRSLDVRQRKVLELFKFHDAITAVQVAELFSLKARSASEWCKKWVDAGFLEIVDFSKKARRYKLADKFAALVQ